MALLGFSINSFAPVLEPSVFLDCVLENLIEYILCSHEFDAILKVW